MATVSPRRARARVSPPVHGKCKWFGPIDAARLDAGQAVLEIVGENGNANSYWVRTIRDEQEHLLGYRLTKFGAGSEAEAVTYDIDITFGQDPNSWSCECWDFLSRRRDGGCRHIASLRSALLKLGLL
jgi:hypothetical protein